MLVAYLGLRLWCPSEHTFLAFPLPSGLIFLSVCQQLLLGVSIHFISRLRRTFHPQN